MKSSFQRKEILIDNLSALKEWSDSLKKFRLQNDLVTYNLNLPEFPPHENLTFSNQINRYHNACGCETGSFFMSITLAITIGTYFISGGKFLSITFSQVLWGAGITLLAAMAGKGMGVLYARWKLIKLSESLEERLHINYSGRRITSR